MGPSSRRGGSEGILSFTDMELPLENQVGEIGHALKNALRGIDTARLFLAAGCVGVAQSCLDSCIKYAKERVQFGKPIGGHHYQDAITATILGGTAQMHQLTIGQQLLEIAAFK
ncbi:hypothetical protein LCGC14_1062790 [marine sediment metagenome]|uniref:Acyl-CoA dehydrogenase/oxidase C-terminal domain-containing protein n=1 Tax=marine sediment metagenome TaxID=412755 RepID=A0A0F9MQ98_9ZZZZ|nr:hypothetical protein [Candidatus Aminicenantes bacterium]